LSEFSVVGLSEFSG